MAFSEIENIIKNLTEDITACREDIDFKSKESGSLVKKREQINLEIAEVV